jgi:hypothetical protein
VPEIRTLRDCERGALLELLDGWELRDGWRGRDFFRRYLDDDPTFDPRNVWVAVECGELVACAQAFPRRLRTALGDQEVAGVGTVFTRSDRRRRGVASAVLRATATDLERRDFAFALLFAERVRWYGELGWRPWCDQGIRLAPPASAPRRSGAEIHAMEPSRDLDDVAALHALYSGSLVGTVVRDPELWQASLRCAGNPDETFLVARQEGRLLAYLRAIVLDGETTLTEWGAAAGQEEQVVALVHRIAVGLRSAASLHLPRIVDAALADALVRAGYSLHAERRLTAMLRLLAVRGSDAASPDLVLDRFVPRRRFSFWLSDRF